MVLFSATHMELLIKRLVKRVFELFQEEGDFYEPTLAALVAVKPQKRGKDPTATSGSSQPPRKRAAPKTNAGTSKSKKTGAGGSLSTKERKALLTKLQAAGAADADGSDDNEEQEESEDPEDDEEEEGDNVLVPGGIRG